MEQFSCCSRWEKCKKVKHCVHPGTDEIPASEWQSSCSAATGYKQLKPKEQVQKGIQEDRKLLLVIDGNSVMHRAFHVTPELISPCGGKHTGAIYGTLKMILNLVTGRKVTHLAVALDGQGPIFRKKIFPDYKANRKNKDPRLIEQLLLLPEVLEALNIKCYSAKEFEADDVIATITTRAEREGYRAIVFSGDRDMIQLVNEHTTVLLSKKGVSELIECTPSTTEYYFGFSPSQITSYKALAGDSSDNIPGAAGIGKVSATKLLKDYGYIENILSIIDIIPSKIGEKIRSSVDDIKLSLELATLNKNAPIRFSPADCSLDIDLIQGNKKLNELGIYTINLTAYVSRNWVIQQKQDVSKVILRSPGGKNYCGVCGHYDTPCSRFLELKNGKIIIDGQIFWACNVCEFELINPDFYKKIEDAVPTKQAQINSGVYIQQPLF